jgi:hypothetical protein
VPSNTSPPSPAGRKAPSAGVRKTRSRLGTARPPALSKVELGPIATDKIYPLDVFRRTIGMGSWGVRSLRRAGLPIVKVAGRGFVLGRDFLEFIEKQKEIVK